MKLCGIKKFWQKIQSQPLPEKPSHYMAKRFKQHAVTLGIARIAKDSNGTRIERILTDFSQHSISRVA